MWSITLIITGLLFFQNPENNCTQCYPIPGKYAASHILISYDGAQRAPATVKRSKKEAKAKAESMIERLRENPNLFEYLATSESDGPSSMKNGYLGGFGPTEMAGPFVKAVKKLKSHKITDEPVKTQFGYHVIRRESLRPKHYSARLLLISHVEALQLKGISRKVTRGKAEAKRQIDLLAKEITPENFMDLLKKNSDYSNQRVALSAFVPGESPIYHDLASVLDHVPFGKVSDVVELSVGYALIWRHRVEQFSASRILICYAGSKYAPVHISRTRSQAQSLAVDLLAKLHQGSITFEETAKTYSDEPFGLRGGVLPKWFKGTGDKTLDLTVDKLEIGELATDVFETRRGFHIVLRKAP